LKVKHCKLLEENKMVNKKTQEARKLVEQAYDCYSRENFLARAFAAGCSVNLSDIYRRDTDYKGKLERALDVYMESNDAKGVEAILKASMDMKLDDLAQKALVSLSKVECGKKLIIGYLNSKYLNPNKTTPLREPHIANFYYNHKDVRDE